MTTPIAIRAEILADLWLNYRDDEEFKDFFSYNDLGLPLSYALSQSVIETNATVEKLIGETFDLFLAALQIESDEGYDSLDGIFSIAE